MITVSTIQLADVQSLKTIVCLVLIDFADLSNIRQCHLVKVHHAIG